MVNQFKSIILELYFEHFTVSDTNKNNNNDGKNHDKNFFYKQLATCIAITWKYLKIENWKELISFIKQNTEKIYSDHNSLFLLNECIKQLSAQRMPIARKKFNLIISEILPFNNFSAILEKQFRQPSALLFVKCFLSFFKATSLVTP